jgi:hypothetical protein
MSHKIINSPYKSKAEFVICDDIETNYLLTVAANNVYIPNQGIKISCQLSVSQNRFKATVVLQITILLAISKKNHDPM